MGRAPSIPPASRQEIEQMKTLWEKVYPRVAAELNRLQAGASAAPAALGPERS